MPAPSIHVIIVNWNAGADLAACVRSLSTLADDTAMLSKITVVDNASTDGSLEPLAEPAGTPPLTLIRNAENRGFAAACNQGASGSQADLLLFLNPDTELRRGSLEAPARYLADPAHQPVGIVGIQLIDRAGRIARTSARFPTALSMIGNSLGLDRVMPALFPPHFLTDWPHSDSRQVDQVMGAFCMIRRSLFEELGGFDERFFLYYEDLDLALRARARGASSVYLATAQALHHGGGSTDTIKDRRLFYLCRSRILYALKHFGLAGAIMVSAVTLVLEPMTRIADALLSRRAREVKQIARATAMLWAALPDIIRTHSRLPDAQASPAHPL